MSWNSCLCYICSRFIVQLRKIKYTKHKNYTLFMLIGLLKIKTAVFSSGKSFKIKTPKTYIDLIKENSNRKYFIYFDVSKYERRIFNKYSLIFKYLCCGIKNLYKKN